MFRTAAIAPPGHVLAPLPVDSKLVAIVRLLGKPLEVTQSSSPWLAEQLPHEDTDFLRRERIHLLVPVTTGADRVEVLLALGLKRSEEPYSRDDLDLLGAIAASLAFLLERPAGPDASARRFEECPVCGACYNSGATACTQEGASLRPVFLPRAARGALSPRAAAWSRRHGGGLPGDRPGTRTCCGGEGRPRRSGGQ